MPLKKYNDVIDYTLAELWACENQIRHAIDSVRSLATDAELRETIQLIDDSSPTRSRWLRCVLDVLLPENKQSDAGSNISGCGPCLYPIDPQKGNPKLTDFVIARAIGRMVCHARKIHEDLVGLTTQLDHPEIPGLLDRLGVQYESGCERLHSIAERLSPIEKRAASTSAPSTDGALAGVGLAAG